MKNAIKQYVMVARKGDLEPGTGKTVDVNGMPVALFNVNGVYHAIHNTRVRTRMAPWEKGSFPTMSSPALGTPTSST
jgi:hypothetical protein